MKRKKLYSLAIVVLSLFLAEEKGTGYFFPQRNIHQWEKVACPLFFVSPRSLFPSDPSKVSIRPIKAQAELEALIELLGLANANLPPVVVQSLDKRWVRVAVDTETGQVIGGFFSIDLQELDGVADITGGFMVHPDWRDKVIGRAMMRVREELFRKAGYQAIQFQVTREDARAFWQHMGYEIVWSDVDNHLYRMRKRFLRIEDELARLEALDDFDDASIARISALLSETAWQITEDPFAPTLNILDLMQERDYWEGVVERLLREEFANSEERQIFLRLLSLSDRSLVSYVNRLPRDERGSRHALFMSAELLTTQMVRFSPENKRAKIQLAEALRHLGKYTAARRILSQLKGASGLTQSQKRDLALCLTYICIGESHREIGWLKRRFGSKGEARLPDILRRFDLLIDRLNIEAIDRLRVTLNRYEELQRKAHREKSTILKDEKIGIPRAYVAMAAAHLALSDFYVFLESRLTNEAKTRHKLKEVPLNALRNNSNALGYCIKGLAVDTENKHTKGIVADSLKSLERLVEFFNILMQGKLLYKETPHILSELEGHLEVLLAENAKGLRNLYGATNLSELNEALRSLKERLKAGVRLWGSIPGTFKEALNGTGEDKLNMDNIQDAVKKDIMSQFGLSEDSANKAWAEWQAEYNFTEKDLKILKGFLLAQQEYQIEPESTGKTAKVVEVASLFAGALDSTITPKDVEDVLASDRYDSLGIRVERKEVIETQASQEPPPLEPYNMGEIANFLKSDRNRIGFLNVAISRLEPWFAYYASAGRWDRGRLKDDLDKLSAEFNKFEETAKPLFAEEKGKKKGGETPRPNNKQEILKRLTQLRSDEDTGYKGALKALADKTDAIKKNFIEKERGKILGKKARLVGELQKDYIQWRTPTQEAFQEEMDYLDALCLGITDEDNKEAYLSLSKFNEVETILEVHRRMVETFKENSEPLKHYYNKFGELGRDLEKFKDPTNIDDTDNRYTQNLAEIERGIAGCKEGLLKFTELCWSAPIEKAALDGLNAAFISTGQRRAQLIQMRLETCRDIVNKYLFVIETIIERHKAHLRQLGILTDQMRLRFSEWQERRRNLRQGEIDGDGSTYVAHIQALLNEASSFSDDLENTLNAKDLECDEKIKACVKEFMASKGLKGDFTYDYDTEADRVEILISPQPGAPQEAMDVEGNSRAFYEAYGGRLSEVIDYLKTRIREANILPEDIEKDGFNFNEKLYMPKTIREIISEHLTGASEHFKGVLSIAQNGGKMPEGFKRIWSSIESPITERANKEFQAEKLRLKDRRLQRELVKRANEVIAGLIIRERKIIEAMVEVYGRIEAGRPAEGREVDSSAIAPQSKMEEKGSDPFSSQFGLQTQDFLEFNRELEHLETLNEFEDEAIARLNGLLTKAAGLIARPGEIAPKLDIRTLVGKSDYLGDVVSRLLAEESFDGPNRKAFLRLLKLCSRALIPYANRAEREDRALLKAIHKSNELIISLMLNLVPNDVEAKIRLAGVRRHLGRFFPEKYVEAMDLLLELEKINALSLRQKRLVQLELAYICTGKTDKEISDLPDELAHWRSISEPELVNYILQRDGLIRSRINVEVARRMKEIVAQYEEIERDSKRRGAEVLESEKDDIPRAYVALAAGHLSLGRLDLFLYDILPEKARKDLQLETLALHNNYEALRYCIKGLRVNRALEHTQMATRNSLKGLGWVSKFINRDISFKEIPTLISELSRLDTLLKENSRLINLCLEEGGKKGEKGKRYTKKDYEETRGALKGLEEKLKAKLEIWNSIPSALKGAINQRQENQLTMNDITYAVKKAIQGELNQDEGWIGKVWQEWLGFYNFDEGDFVILKCYFESEGKRDADKESAAVILASAYGLDEKTVKSALRNKYAILDIRIEEAQSQLPGRSRVSREERIYNLEDIKDFLTSDKGRIDSLTEIIKGLEPWLAASPEAAMGKKWDWANLEKNLEKIKSDFETFKEMGESLLKGASNNTSDTLKFLTGKRAGKDGGGGYVEELRRLEGKIEIIKRELVLKEVERALEEKSRLVGELKRLLGETWQTQSAKIVQDDLEQVEATCKAITDDGKEEHLSEATFAEAASRLKKAHNRIEAFKEGARPLGEYYLKFKGFEGSLAPFEAITHIDNTAHKYTERLNEFSDRIKAYKRRLLELTELSWGIGGRGVELSKELEPVLSSVEEAHVALIQMRVESCSGSINKCLFVIETCIDKYKQFLDRTDISKERSELSGRYLGLQQARVALKQSTATAKREEYLLRIEEYLKEGSSLFEDMRAAIRAKYDECDNLLKGSLDQFQRSEGLEGKLTFAYNIDDGEFKLIYSPPDLQSKGDRPLSGEILNKFKLLYNRQITIALSFYKALYGAFHILPEALERSGSSYREVLFESRDAIDIMTRHTNGLVSIALNGGRMPDILGEIRASIEERFVKATREVEQAILTEDPWAMNEHEDMVTAVIMERIASSIFGLISGANVAGRESRPKEIGQLSDEERGMIEKIVNETEASIRGSSKEIKRVISSKAKRALRSSYSVEKSTIEEVILDEVEKYMINMVVPGIAIKVKRALRTKQIEQLKERDLRIIGKTFEFYEQTEGGGQSRDAAVDSSAIAPESEMTRQDKPSSKGHEAGSLAFSVLPAAFGPLGIMAEEDTRDYSHEREVSARFLRMQQETYGYEAPSSQIYQEINEVFAKVLRAAGYDADEFSLQVLHSEEANASVCIYINSVLVYKGLIELFIEEGAILLDELAAVLAHEVAHVKLGLYRKGQKIYGRDPFEDMIERGQEAIEEHIFQHDQESRADREAVHIVDQAGFNPYGVLSCMEKLNRQVKSEAATDLFEYSMLSSHPPTRQRIVELRRHLSLLPYRNREKPLQRSSPVVWGEPLEGSGLKAKQMVEALKVLQPMQEAWQVAWCIDEFVDRLEKENRRVPTKVENWEISQEEKAFFEALIEEGKRILNKDVRFKSLSPLRQDILIYLALYRKDFAHLGYQFAEEIFQGMESLEDVKAVFEEFKDAIIGPAFLPEFQSDSVMALEWFLGRALQSLHKRERPLSFKKGLEGIVSFDKVLYQSLLAIEERHLGDRLVTQWVSLNAPQDYKEFHSLLGGLLKAHKGGAFEELKRPLVILLEPPQRKGKRQIQLSAPQLEEVFSLLGDLEEVADDERESIISLFVEHVNISPYLCYKALGRFGPRVGEEFDTLLNAPYKVLPSQQKEGLLAQANLPDNVWAIRKSARDNRFNYAARCIEILEWAKETQGVSGIQDEFKFLLSLGMEPIYYLAWARQVGATTSQLEIVRQALKVRIQDQKERQSRYKEKIQQKEEAGISSDAFRYYAFSGEAFAEIKELQKLAELLAYEEFWARAKEDSAFRRDPGVQIAWIGENFKEGAARNFMVSEVLRRLPLKRRMALWETAAGMLTSPEERPRATEIANAVFELGTQELGGIFFKSGFSYLTQEELAPLGVGPQTYWADKAADLIWPVVRKDPSWAALEGALRLETICSIYKSASSRRDALLLKEIQPQDAEGCLALVDKFYSIKERLQMGKRAWALYQADRRETPRSLEEEFNFLIRAFPEPSLVRDEVIDELLLGREVATSFLEVARTYLFRENPWISEHPSVPYQIGVRQSLLDHVRRMDYEEKLDILDEAMGRIYVSKEEVTLSAYQDRYEFLVYLLSRTSPALPSLLEMGPRPAGLTGSFFLALENFIAVKLGHVKLRDLKGEPYEVKGIYEYGFPTSNFLAEERQSPGFTPKQIENLERLRRFIEILKVILNEYEEEEQIDLLARFLARSLLESSKDFGRYVGIFLEEMGIPAVKAGQYFSELGFIPQDLRGSLAYLKSEVKPMSVFEVWDILRTLYDDQTIAEEFSTVGPLLGSGSVRQTHKLPNTDEVAKVKRTRQVFVIEGELERLQRIVSALNARPDLMAGLIIPEALVNDVARLVSEEALKAHEIENQEFFERLLSRVRLGDGRRIIVPRLNKPFCNPLVIVEKFVPGVPFSKYRARTRAEGDEIRTLLLNLYLTCMFKEERYHADPHSDNVLIERSQMGLIDFGMVSHLSKDEQARLLDLVAALANERPNDLIHLLLRIYLEGGGHSDLGALNLDYVILELSHFHQEMKASQESLEKKVMRFLTVVDNLRLYLSPEVRHFIKVVGEMGWLIEGNEGRVLELLRQYAIQYKMEQFLSGKWMKRQELYDVAVVDTRIAGLLRSEGIFLERGTQIQAKGRAGLLGKVSEGTLVTAEGLSVGIQIPFETEVPLDPDDPSLGETVLQGSFFLTERNVGRYLFRLPSGWEGLAGRLAREAFLRQAEAGRPSEAAEAAIESSAIAPESTMARPRGCGGAVRRAGSKPIDTPQFSML